MPCKIAIASGKGGTGKTTVAVYLFHFIKKYWSDSVLLVDCDVEEPDDLVFFPGARRLEQKIVNQLIPEIQADLCTYCRKCVEYCAFNALVVIPSVKFAEINKDLCHSCGACIAVCPSKAILEHPEAIGEINNFRTVSGNNITEGKLKIGSTMHTMLIRELVREPDEKHEIVLFDAPPGTSCSVVATVHDADYVVLVSEPTPFGLHDLKITIDMLREMGKSMGVVINKSGLGDTKIFNYLDEEYIDILGQIPFSRGFASKYASGELLEDIPVEIENVFRDIILGMKKQIEEYV